MHAALTKLASALFKAKKPVKSISSPIKAHVVSRTMYACACDALKAAKLFESGQFLYDNVSPSPCPDCVKLCADKDEQREKEKRRADEEDRQRRLVEEHAQHGGDDLVFPFRVDLTKVTDVDAQATFLLAGERTLVGPNFISYVNTATAVTTKTPVLTATSASGLLTSPPAAQLRATRPRPIYIPSPSASSIFSLSTSLVSSPPSSLGPATPEEEQPVSVFTPYGQNTGKGWF